MDVFSHGLWGGALSQTKKKTSKAQYVVAALFGMLPDIISFLPVQVYFFMTRTQFSESLFYPPQHWVFNYAIESYNYTHSLVIFAFVTIVFTIARKGKFYLPFAAWGLHILMDIPTHVDFFPTPFLFPFSNYRFTGGVDWWTPWLFFTNWGAIVAVYGYILYRRRKRFTL